MVPPEPEVPEGRSRPTVSLWLRRDHMHAALFLVPWVLIYATSTLVMNHSSHFSGPAEAPVRERVSEQAIDAIFAPGTTAEKNVELSTDSAFTRPDEAKGEKGCGGEVFGRRRA